GVVLQNIGTGDDVDVAGFGKRLAGVEGFQFGKFVIALTQDVHGFAQDARTLHGGHRRPYLLPFGSAGHGAVDIALAGALHPGQHLAGGGVDAVEGFSAAGGDVLATDVELLFGETGHGLSSELVNLLREQPILFKLNDQSTKTTECYQMRHDPGMPAGWKDGGAWCDQPRAAVLPSCRSR